MKKAASEIKVNDTIKVYRGYAKVTSLEARGKKILFRYVNLDNIENSILFMSSTKIEVIIN